MDTNFPLQKKKHLFFFKKNVSANKNHALICAFLGDIHPPMGQASDDRVLSPKVTKVQHRKSEKKHLQWLFAYTKFLGNLEHVKQKNEMLKISRNHITLRSCFLFAVVNVIKVKERCVILSFFVFFDVFASQSHTVGHFQRPFFPLCRLSHLVGLSSLFIFIKGKDSEGSWRHPKP